MSREKRCADEEEITGATTSDFDRVTRTKPLSFDATLSTGSTLLDLCISGGKCAEGGIPGGIVVEIFGRPGSGKTAILAELFASAQSKGGDAMFKDPEARLDKEYAKIYGVRLDAKNYSRP